MSGFLDIDLAFGGYYACTSAEAPGYSLIRILDFNRDAYHAALFSQSFDALPGAEELEALSPSVGHAPVDARGLLNNTSMTLVRQSPLTRDCLEGYMFYLEHFGVSDEEREEYADSLIAFSHDAPIKLRLSLADDELHIEERA